MDKLTQYRAFENFMMDFIYGKENDLWENFLLLLAYMVLTKEVPEQNLLFLLKYIGVDFDDSTVTQKIGEWLSYWEGTGMLRISDEGLGVFSALKAKNHFYTSNELENVQEVKEYIQLYKNQLESEEGLK